MDGSHQASDVELGLRNAAHEEQTTRPKKECDNTRMVILFIAPDDMNIRGKDV